MSSYLPEDEVQPYLQDLLNRAVPTWDSMCDKLDEVGFVLFVNVISVVDGSMHTMLTRIRRLYFYL